MPDAVDRLRDRLVRGVLAGDVAAAAFDAEVLVDARLGDVVEVEVLPVGDVRRGAADEVGRAWRSPSRHPSSSQARDHLLHDLEAVGHRRGADLHVAGAERHELGRVAPGGDAADAGDRQAARLRVAGDLRHHVQRDRLHRRAAIAAMRALAVDRSAPARRCRG